MTRELVRPADLAPAAQLEAQFRYITDVYGRALGEYARQWQAALAALGTTLARSSGARADRGDPTGDGPL